MPSGIAELRAEHLNAQMHVQLGQGLEIGCLLYGVVLVVFDRSGDPTLTQTHCTDQTHSNVLRVALSSHRQTGNAHEEALARGGGAYTRRKLQMRVPQGKVACRHTATGPD